MKELREYAVRWTIQGNYNNAPNVRNILEKQDGYHRKINKQRIRNRSVNLKYEHPKQKIREIVKSG